MPYIVVFDDQAGLCVPYGFDASCAGALDTTEPVAAFHTRKDAQRAVRVSRRHAEMREAQGLPASDDFLKGGIQYVRIIKLEFARNLPWQDT